VKVFQGIKKCSDGMWREAIWKANKEKGRKREKNVDEM